MKRSFFAIAVFLVSSFAYAQESGDSEITEEKPEKATEPVSNNYFGIKAGINYAGVFQTGYNTDEMVIAPNIGLFFESRQNDKFSFLLEANYSQKGGILSDTSGSYDYTLNYLDVPLMINYYPIKNLSIGIGIQPSIVLNGNVTYNTKNPDTTFTHNIPEKDLEVIAAGNSHRYFPMYFGFVAGVNYKITERFNVDVKYNPKGLFTDRIRMSAITVRFGFAIVKNTN